jgi:long-chain acyl-CoA synthetase
VAQKHPWDRRLGVWWIAEDHPELPAIVASPTNETLTFAELATRAHRVVHALRSRGIRAGDVLVYALPNGVDTVVWQLAAQEAGLRYITINPALSGGEIRAIVDHSGAVAAVIDQQYGDRVGDYADAASIRLRVSIGGDIAGFERDGELLDGHPTSLPSDRQLGGAFVYTSGTTGKPKGIRRRFPEGDPSMVADAMKTFGHAFRFQPLEGAHLVSAGMHHGGCQGFYLGALNVGQALAILGKFDPEQALAAIARHKVTTAYMVPTQFVRFLRLPAEVKAKYDVSSLEVVVHSAAPCPLDVKKQMFDWWGPVVWETYGGMEGPATIAKPHHWLARPGTVGRAIRGMQVRILDDEGGDVAPGELGGVYLEPADGIAFEYHEDAEATASIRKGKAFTIGDVGYLDDDGFLFLADRAKDMIISGGVNVYPAEVEGVLHGHPAVADVAVIGVPDDEWGESVKAVVELDDASAPNDALADELIAFCRERLAGFKCPRTVDFREALPRTESGKLQKREIRSEYWQAAGRAL